VFAALTEKERALIAAPDEGRSKGRQSPWRRPWRPYGNYVLPTDEELMIARHALALLAGRGRQSVA
jgi:hypothetical protein